MVKRTCLFFKQNRNPSDSKQQQQQQQQQLSSTSETKREIELMDIRGEGTSSTSRSTDQHGQATTASHSNGSRGQGHGGGRGDGVTQWVLKVQLKRLCWLGFNFDSKILCSRVVNCFDWVNFSFRFQIICFRFANVFSKDIHLDQASKHEDVFNPQKILATKTQLFFSWYIFQKKYYWSHRNRFKQY